MSGISLLLGCLLAAPLADGGAASSPKPEPKPEDLAAYERVKARAGQDAESQVKLALWCETHQLSAERMKHLALAVLRDPANVTARGLMGLVGFGGQWKRPDAVASRVQADEALSAALAQYNARREKAAQTAEAQWKLALWCAEKGLDAEARAHFTAVTRLDPSRDAAWRRLGCEKVGGRWVSKEQRAAEKAEADAQRQADQRYGPLLAKWRTALGGRNEAKRREAEDALASLSDPRALPALLRTFGRGGEPSQTLVVQALGKMDGTDASRALAALAVFSPMSEVRRSATETLRHRDLRDVAGWLIALIRKPAKYEVRPVDGPGSVGVLFVEGERFNVQRLYAPPPLPNIPLFPGEPIEYDQFGLPVVSRFLGGGTSVTTSSSAIWRQVTLDQYQGRAPTDPEAQRIITEARNNGSADVGVGRLRSRTVDISERTKETRSTPLESTVRIPVGQLMVQYQTAALVAQKQLEADLAAVEAFNEGVRVSNERVTQTLRALTGHDEGEDQQAWSAWWTDQQGYAYQPPAEAPKPTAVQNVPLAYVPQGVPIQRQTFQTGPSTSTFSTTATASNSMGHSCFRAGTVVRTLTGPKPIESIAVGDRVLVEDVAKGALSYQPVLTVFHNRPAALFRVDLGGDVVWATGIHRFWKAGQGWVMARDLKPGDRLRTLEGLGTVAAVSEGPVEPVYNLEVAEGQSFFVGDVGVLVHDNSLVQPVSAPFDAPPVLAELTARKD